jgi:D-3-phosphoglycerate dehydrogenase
MHAGHWDKATHKSVELEGRTVGVIGLGAIGLRFARMADAMGMRVLGFDPYAKDLPPYVERGGPGHDLARRMPSRCTAR